MLREIVIRSSSVIGERFESPNIFNLGSVKGPVTGGRYYPCD